MSDTFTLAGQRVWVAGARGMVGSALVRRLASESCEVLQASRSDLDLRRQRDVEQWVEKARPDVIFLAAAKVGGILANASHPGQFLYDNLMIATNVLEAARLSGVKKLLFLGSSCIYPAAAPQPIPEDALLTGLLEPSNEAYAVAKIAGIKLAQAYRREYGCEFISAQPANLYGPADNFDLAAGHVIAALLRKADAAKRNNACGLGVWGSGTPKREFLHVDDLADALVFLAKHYSKERIVNVGSGEEITIRALAELVCRVVGFRGELTFDPTKPDGVARKVVDDTTLRSMGWCAKRSLDEGLAETYRWFLDHREEARLGPSGPGGARGTSAGR
jgi:GDP-L-fucose synthase